LHCVTATNLNAQYSGGVTGEAATEVEVFEEGLILSLTPASQTVKVPPPAQTSTQETPGTELRRSQPSRQHTRPAAGRGRARSEAQEQEDISAGHR